MRYAIISDIHGNMPALKAVLDDSQSRSIDYYIFLGDYYISLPYPDEVVSAVRSIKNSYCIKGNEENHTKRLATQNQVNWTDAQFTATYCAFNSLSKDSLHFLCDLPNQEIIKSNGLSIIATHSSMAYFDNPIFRDFSCVNFVNICDKKLYETKLTNKLMEDRSFQNTLANQTHDIFLFGHSHIQYHITLNDKLIINPGSCGLPLDFRQGASYTILDICNGKCDVEELRVKYDIESTIKYIRSSDQYKKARVWSDIIISELNMSQERVSFFLKFVSDYADKINDTTRPYTHETWETAYELWSNDIS